MSGIVCLISQYLVCHLKHMVKVPEPQKLWSRVLYRINIVKEGLQNVYQPVDCPVLHRVKFSKWATTAGCSTHGL